MKSKVFMNDSSKIKITLIRDDRINFRYDGVLYSLQENRWDGTGGVDFRVFEDGKFRYLNSSFDVFFVGVKNLFNMKNGDSFKKNIIYSHIDKSSIIHYLHSLDFIEVGDFMERFYLKKELDRNRENQEFVKRQFKKDILLLKQEERELLRKLNMEDDSSSINDSNYRKLGKFLYSKLSCKRGFKRN